MQLTAGYAKVNVLARQGTRSLSPWRSLARHPGASRIARTWTATLLNLLAVEFTETDAPAGVVTLMFSGGAALRLEVECLEVELADLGPVWTTTCCPIHQHETT